ncbi:LacI family transcriptional regulator [Paenibacillus sp. TRM 82003]|uniref:LacI family DNA-binding transcriptional regulator n=1 Tax=Kineococcus sp. TRM81007 TaxID=2925831 RepID=UPI001F581253|nr:LacI family DNA-binding transcriptional regulator [Kineococcus sp. TRM81007]MCI2239597.1 LacI family transcriptional regulator [Kineococcus sp. TRM81007]MCI3926121.1 LacI family transcriptional regulator [Paenibacillus sp. TRM 82003]
MARVPTSKDVARIAGVSQSTVSYVMSGKRPISEKTRRLVEDAIAQLTYQPNAGARALAGRRTNVIAAVVPFRSPLSAHGLMAFVEEIALAARARDHDLLIVTADEGPGALQRVVGGALCDAVVVMEVRTEDERAAVARSLSRPALFIGVPGDSAGLHCVDFDFEGAAALLVAELAGAGNREVAVLGWTPEAEERGINYVPRFRAAAERAAAERGVALRWCAVPAGQGAVEHCLADVLSTPGAPPGLVVTTGAQEVLNALLRRDLVAGRDVDLVALSTDAEAEAQAVPLTAVSTQPRDVSRQAMEWLFELLDDPAAPGEVRRVPAELTRRRSVRTAG